jgi:hypothetical protein
MTKKHEIRLTKARELIRLVSCKATDQKEVFFEHLLEFKNKTISRDILVSKIEGMFEGNDVVLFAFENFMDLFGKD